MKPILFNTDMVRAILEGRKTVTRRVVKPQPDGQPVLMGEDSCWPAYFAIQGTEKVIRPPYQPGDILWVRETWQAVYETEWSNDEPYKGQNIRELIPNFDSIQKVEAGLSQECSSMAMRPRMKYFVFKASDIEYADNENGLVWRPSIHMPREAARIFLRVTGVRVDRLQEYGDLAKEVTRDTVRKVAKTCRQEIRAASPYRTGRYSKGWRVKETASPNGDVTETVYNASAPGLTHLLEDGHATVNGGRVAGKAHIAPAEQQAEANLLEGLERELSL